MREYTAEIIRPSGLVGDSINIETRKFTRANPKQYENCNDNFYVIHTQDNTTVKVMDEVDNNCIFLDEEGKVQLPYYIQTDKDAHINGKKFIIESLDRNITKQNKYSVKPLTGTHKAQILITKKYTICSLSQEHDGIIRSADYDTLVAIKIEKKIGVGVLPTTNG